MNGFMDGLIDGPVKRLILAPHCDDETLGCGGMLAKYPHESAVVVISTPDEVRLKEFEVAKEILGYQTSCFLGLRDGNIGEDMHSLVGLLDEVVAQFQPRGAVPAVPVHAPGPHRGLRGGDPRRPAVDDRRALVHAVALRLRRRGVRRGAVPDGPEVEHLRVARRGGHRQEGRRPERLLVAGGHRSASAQQHQAAGEGDRQRPAGRRGPSRSRWCGGSADDDLRSAPAGPAALLGLLVQDGEGRPLRPQDLGPVRRPGLPASRQDARQVGHPADGQAGLRHRPDHQQADHGGRPAATWPTRSSSVTRTPGRSRRTGTSTGR